MVNASPLPSIFDLTPLDSGGREARKGFDYQDHIAVGFCLLLFERPELEEVWCETHDDITLVWRNNGSKIIEFIQVKSGDLSSRWSVAILCKRERSNDKPKIGSSVLEQSLARARCQEQIMFRMVTPIDVDDDLKILKLEIEHPDRKIASLIPLQQQIEGKLSGVEAPNGFKCCDWVSNCYWDKRDSEAGVINGNKVQLDKILHYENQLISPDHRDELYQRLLAFVQHASKVDYTLEPTGYRIDKTKLKDYILKNIQLMGYGGVGSLPEGMEQKMRRCVIPSDQIATASEQRRIYNRERITSRFISGEELIYVEAEVTAKLHLLLSALDAGRIDGSGIQFHDHCLLVIEDLYNNWTLPVPRPSIAVLQGYMYERTNRCTHRFDRVHP